MKRSILLAMCACVVVCISSLAIGQSDPLIDYINARTPEGFTAKCIYNKNTVINYSSYHCLQLSINLSKGKEYLLIAKGEEHLNGADTCIFSPNGAILVSGDILNTALNITTEHAGVHSIVIGAEKIAGTHSKINVRVYALTPTK
jgi:hypothetical protein